MPTAADDVTGINNPSPAGVADGVAPPGGVPAPTFAGGDLHLDPGYQFRISEGEKAIRRSAAAGSGVHSGATLKALQEHGQDVGSREFGAARRRAIEDHDLARRAYFDELGLEDRARSHYYQDVGYQDAQFADEREFLLRLAGLGGAATDSSARIAAQFGQLYGNARQYGVEGFGASRVAAGSESIMRAYGQGDFWNVISEWLIGGEFGAPGDE